MQSLGLVCSTAYIKHDIGRDVGHVGDVIMAGVIDYDVFLDKTAEFVRSCPT